MISYPFQSPFSSVTPVTTCQYSFPNAICKEPIYNTGFEDRFCLKHKQELGLISNVNVKKSNDNNKLKRKFMSEILNEEGISHSENFNELGEESWSSSISDSDNEKEGIKNLWDDSESDSGSDNPKDVDYYISDTFFTQKI